MGFWNQPQGAAVFKHAFLDVYAPLYASKVGKYSKGHRVDILDGYAGRGWYKDGSPGSPARMLATAEKLAARREVHCWFVEENRTNYEKLKRGLVAAGANDRVQALHGTMSKHLPTVLRGAEGFPLFCFIDPFGLGIPFDELISYIMGRTSWIGGRRVGPPTEVLINFVYAGIYRNAGQLHASSDDPVQRQAAATKVADLDRNLGGPWWRQLVDEAFDTPSLVDAIRQEYVGRVLEAAGPGWRYMRAAVSDSPGGQPIYDLLHFCQHEQGSWFFNEAVSLARQVFQTHFEDGGGIFQYPLFEPEDEWVAAIRANLQRMLQRGERFRVIDRMEDVYGSTAGQARGFHVKRALRELTDSGVNVGKCNLEPHELKAIPGPSARRTA